ncbi:MAG: site-specific DNA-methyltransferase [Acidobacteriota bacterium]
MDGAIKITFTCVRQLYISNRFSSLIHYTEIYDKAQRKFNANQAKQELGIPDIVKRALMEDGWICRSTIIWSKPNVMPSPVTDRPTTSHEYVFLLAKSPHYYFDAESIKEPCSGNAHSRGNGSSPKQNSTKAEGFVRSNETFRTHLYQPETRNARTVWTIRVEKLSEPHYAAFPEELARRCILASTSERGACARCGAQHERILEIILPSEQSVRPQAREAARRFEEAGLTHDHIKAIRAVGITDTERARAISDGTGNNDREMERLAAEAKAALGGYYREFLTNEKRTVGWRAGCSCEAGLTRAVVLDPFAGSGTTGRAAIRLGRRAILIELSSEYAAIIDRRCRVTLGLPGMA